MYILVPFFSLNEEKEKRSSPDTLLLLLVFAFEVSFIIGKN
jgi:hypothetical protein